jgi:hypothetical protein
VTVTAAQITRVKDAGFENVDAIARACNSTKCPFYLAVAMIEKESKGRNVYGSDSGGALEDFPIEVNQGNFEVFWWLVNTKGQTSNGVGPAQLTSPDFFTQMKTAGLKPWTPTDNIYFGVRLIYGYYQKARAAGNGPRESIRWAGTWYNAGPNKKEITAYGNEYLDVALKWKARLGRADYS